MPVFWLLLIILGLSLLGYVLSRARALSSAGGDSRILHSQPKYYGMNAAIFTAVPSLLVLGIWLFVQPMVINSAVSGMIPEHLVSEGSSLDLMMSDVECYSVCVGRRLPKDAPAVGTRLDCR